MSTYTHRLIEARIDGKWRLVDWVNQLQGPEFLDEYRVGKCGFKKEVLEEAEHEVYPGKMEKMWKVKAFPFFINNGGDIRDYYLSESLNPSWCGRGIPSDIDEATDAALNSYWYLSSWRENEDGSPAEENGCFDKTYVGLDEISSKINEENERLEREVERYVEKRTVLELKKLNVQNDTARMMLDDEANELSYMFDEIRELHFRIMQLESESAFADGVVNNPSFLCGERDIRIIYFKTR